MVAIYNTRVHMGVGRAGPGDCTGWYIIVEGGCQNSEVAARRVLWEARLDELPWEQGIAHAVP